MAIDSSDNLYVNNVALGLDNVVVFNHGAVGDVAPSRTISGSNTGLNGKSGLCLCGIAVDPTGKLYVANDTTNAITVYAPGASGNVAPMTTISGSQTGLRGLRDLAVDTGGRIYVTSSSEQGEFVKVYAAGASGNVPPIAAINLLYTCCPAGINVDSTGNIFVSFHYHPSTDSIEVYAPGSNGNTPPIRNIVGSLTALSYPGKPALRYVPASFNTSP